MGPQELQIPHNILDAMPTPKHASNSSMAIIPTTMIWGWRNPGFPSCSLYVPWEPIIAASLLTLAQCLASLSSLFSAWLQTTPHVPEIP